MKTIPDLKIEIAQLERKLAFYSYYSQHDDVEATEYKLIQLRAEYEAYNRNQR